MKSHLLPTFRRLTIAAALVSRILAADSIAPISPLEGSWRWSITNTDGGIIQPTLRVTTADDGTLTGISRFRPGSALPVTNLTVTGTAVAFEVVRTRNDDKVVTRYRGTLKGDNINGTILAIGSGEETTYDWNASRFSDIEGVWKWRFAGAGGGGAGSARRGGPGGRGEISLTLLREEGEQYSGKLHFGRAEQEIHHLSYRNDNLSFHTIRERSDGSMSTNYYWGRFARGSIKGKNTSDFGGVRRTNDWHATRSE